MFYKNSLGKKDKLNSTTLRMYLSRDNKTCSMTLESTNVSKNMLLFFQTFPVFKCLSSRELATSSFIIRPELPRLKTPTKMQQLL